MPQDEYGWEIASEQNERMVGLVGLEPTTKGL